MTAQAADGMIEGVEWNGDPNWVVGVQWHPERMVGDRVRRANCSRISWPRCGEGHRFTRRSRSRCTERLRVPRFDLLFMFIRSVFTPFGKLFGGIMISLAGKAALITGGSRGIGAAAVKLFAQAGADVVFSYQKAKDAAQTVEQEAGKHGTRVEAFQGRRRQPRGTTRNSWTHAICSAGAAGYRRAERGSLEHRRSAHRKDDREAVGRNDSDQSEERVLASFTSAVPHMIKQKSGKIIPITSTAAQRGESFHSHYGASKGAIVSLVKGLSTELARHNILVNSVAPGWVATDMSNPVINTKAGSKAVAAAIPLGRAATAEEIAGPILFLASDLANFLCGEIINVNGGFGSLRLSRLRLSPLKYGWRRATRLAAAAAGGLLACDYARAAWAGAESG